MSKLKDWWNKNFIFENNLNDKTVNSNDLDHAKIVITQNTDPVSDPINEEEEIFKKENNEGAKLFINAYDRTYSLPPEKSYIFDKLDEIFLDQKTFTIQIDNQYKERDFCCYNFSKDEYDIYYDINCAIEELVEAIRELNTKKWKQERKTVNRDKVLEELVDCTKFINQAILRLGYNANDFYELHKKKSEINRQRQRSGY